MAVTCDYCGEPIEGHGDPTMPTPITVIGTVVLQLHEECQAPVADGARKIKGAKPPKPKPATPTTDATQ